MKNILYLTGLILIVVFFICLSFGAKMQEVKNHVPEVLPQKLNQRAMVKPDINFGKIPLYFISNEGQVNQLARFYAKASQYTLWITKEGLVFDSAKRPEVRGQKSEGAKHTSRQRRNDSTFQRDVSRLMFIGVKKEPEIVQLNVTNLKVNYFKGNDPSEWVGGIPTSQAVLYKDLYKNIDLKVYGIEKQVEYDWIVNPGGNPEDIRFQYINVKKTQIDKDGNLVITTKFGKLMHKKPQSYQIYGDRRRAMGNGVKLNTKENIRSEFKNISKNTYGFEVGEYDRNIDLVIDPVVLVYSTYLGGGNDDYGTSIILDSSGYAYVTGYTWSTDFPTLNQYQVDQGSQDAFVTKLDTTQSGSSSLLYSTYLGGSGSEYGYGVAVDSNGHTYVTGYTGSTNFPVKSQYQTDQADHDVFITKLDTTLSGTSSLLYSTYLGGSDKDRGFDITVDINGYVYVTGDSDSSDFPCLNQYQTDQSTSDAFVTKLDTTKSGTACLIYSTYLGGNGSDRGYGIVVDGSENAYVTGTTGSPGFPVLDHYQAKQGDVDVFVTRIDTTQIGTASLIYSSCLGGADSDNGLDIAIDNSGFVYATGETMSTDFPTLNQYMNDPGDGLGDVFVAKLDTSLTGIPSLLYSTYLGGNLDERGSGITVDSSGYVYVTGYTGSTDFPTLNQYQADQGSGDAFVTKLDTTQSGTACLLYSTYLGGNDLESGFDITVDSKGNAYITGETLSPDFPIQNHYMSDPGDGLYNTFITRLVLPEINITSPDGGEIFLIGTLEQITWSASLPPGKLVDITLIKPNGVELKTFARGINADLGYLNRVIPSVLPARDYRLKIEVRGMGLSDKSDAPFTVSSPSITLTSPNGGENWQIGTTENITWDSALLPGNHVKIVLLKTNGTAILGIANNLDPTTGTFAWNIPAGLPVRDYLVKIKVKNKAISDLSDSVFSLY